MIGIISRLDKTPSDKDAYIVYKAINDVLINYNVVTIGILPNNIDNIKKTIDLCKGIILGGGDNFSNLDFEIIKYIYDNNIPCLGICLGMQEMGYLFNGTMKHIINHKDTYHKVLINNSNIYKDGYISVNSRHKDSILTTNLEITGKSLDNTIEMIEDKQKTFFVGVQWHPENLYQDDKDAQILFDKFIESTNK